MPSNHKLDHRLKERLEEELEAQKIWRPLRPETAQMADTLLKREFMDPAIAADLESHELANILRHARRAVPYYRTHPAWARLPLDSPVFDRESLAELPV